MRRCSNYHIVFVGACVRSCVRACVRGLTDPNCIRYVVPGVLCLVFLLLLGLPLIFVRCCCSRKCCAPHHPLWGQDNGTLEDFPEPKCCAGSRSNKVSKQVSSSSCRRVVVGLVGVAWHGVAC